VCLLPQLAAPLGQLDPVVDGVADDLGEGVPERVDQTGVGLDAVRVEAQADGLAARRRRVADGAVELAEDREEGNQPHPQDQLLQVGGEPFQIPVRLERRAAAVVLQSPLQPSA
jgi:hypothetical protein